jgi:uncharacterized protein
MKKPEPRITPDNAPFYKALEERRFVLPYCTDCGKPHLPPAPVCPFCFCDQVHWKEASGQGRISTWTVVQKAWFPAFANDIPYNVVQVELDEGPRLTANVVGIRNEELRIGLPVEIEYGHAIPRFQVIRGRDRNSEDGALRAAGIRVPSPNSDR